MAEYDIPPISTSYVRVSFRCTNPNCYGVVDSGLLGVPLPNSEGENQADSLVLEDDVLECTVCYKEYSISIGCGYGGAYVELPEVDEDETEVSVFTYDEEDCDDFDRDQIDSYLQNSNSFEKFRSEIGKLRFLISQNFPNEEIYQVIYRQVFSGAITCMEEYLADLLINKVANDDDVFWIYFETFPKEKVEKLKSTNRKLTRKGIEGLIMKRLLNTNFHRINHVEKVYSKVFDITFPSKDAVCKIIQDRHDMVHRNGKTKDGTQILLNKAYLNRIFDIVESFIKKIDESINEENKGDLPFKIRRQ